MLSIPMILGVERSMSLPLQFIEVIQERSEELKFFSSVNLCEIYAKFE